MHGVRPAAAHFEFQERMFNIGATKDWMNLREEGGSIERDKDERSPMTKKLKMK